MLHSIQSVADAGQGSKRIDGGEDGLGWLVG